MEATNRVGRDVVSEGGRRGAVGDEVSEHVAELEAGVHDLVGQ
ncbi:MAG: hypothetical protein WD598_18175 [Acidimicrobiia bacterium]